MHKAIEKIVEILIVGRHESTVVKVALGDESDANLLVAGIAEPL